MIRFDQSVLLVQRHLGCLAVQLDLLLLEFLALQLDPLRQLRQWLQSDLEFLELQSDQLDLELRLDQWLPGYLAVQSVRLRLSIQSHLLDQ